MRVAGKRGRGEIVGKLKRGCGKIAGSGEARVWGNGGEMKRGCGEIAGGGEARVRVKLRGKRSEGAGKSPGNEARVREEMRVLSHGHGQQKQVYCY